VHVCLFQLPHWQHPAIGLHVVVAVLKLAAGRLSAALRSAEPQTATHTHSTCIHSAVGPITTDDAQSTSAAVNRSSNSSK